MSSSCELPLEIAVGASVRGNEYGWDIAAFPSALSRAEALGYACLGGQFQFRLEDGSTCEMYWLSADSDDRKDSESWTDYSRRSCSGVLQNFERLIEQTDFVKQAANWQLQIDAKRALVFVAYFVSEAEWTAIQAARPS